MPSFLRTIVGPRVLEAEFAAHPFRYVMPSILLSIARVMLLLSLFFPYWEMELVAPQYPDGLFLTAYVHHLEGDVREIDGLNHYIGMRPLDEAARIEREMSIWAVVAMVLLVEGAAFVHSKWAILLALPAILFPVAFLADLYFWMRKFGQHLDPKAPLSSSVKPFTPTILGEGGIGQFRTYAEIQTGLWLAIGCAGLTIVAFWFHRRAYRPLALRMAPAPSASKS